MPTYIKTFDQSAFNRVGGWLVRDQFGITLAILDDERLADQLLYVLLNADGVGAIGSYPSDVLLDSDTYGE